jgi:hypothetical protein
VINPSFEDGLNGWTVETDYIGRFGFSASPDAKGAVTGTELLCFAVVAFPGCTPGTPWDGKIYQTIAGLKDGVYTFRVHADAVGSGMYLWANGGKQEEKVRIRSTLAK